MERVTVGDRERLGERDRVRDTVPLRDAELQGEGVREVLPVREGELQEEGDLERLFRGLAEGDMVVVLLTLMERELEKGAERVRVSEGLRDGLVDREGDVLTVNTTVSRGEGVRRPLNVRQAVEVVDIEGDMEGELDRVGLPEKEGVLLDSEEVEGDREREALPEDELDDLGEALELGVPLECIEEEEHWEADMLLELQAVLVVEVEIEKLREEVTEMVGATEGVRLVVGSEDAERDRVLQGVVEGEREGLLHTVGLRDIEGERVMEGRTVLEAHALPQVEVEWVAEGDKERLGLPVSLDCADTVPDKKGSAEKEGVSVSAEGVTLTLVAFRPVVGLGKSETEGEAVALAIREALLVVECTPESELREDLLGTRVPVAVLLPRCRPASPCAREGEGGALKVSSGVKVVRLNGEPVAALGGEGEGRAEGLGLPLGLPSPSPPTPLVLLLDWRGLLDELGQKVEDGEGVRTDGEAVSVPKRAPTSPPLAKSTPAVPLESAELVAVAEALRVAEADVLREGELEEDREGVGEVD